MRPYSNAVEERAALKSSLNGLDSAIDEMTGKEGNLSFRETARLIGLYKNRTAVIERLDEIGHG